MNLRDNALTILQETSRTFYIPISRLPDRLLEAVASAYLCMRAIDEVEDHPDLDNFSKSQILRQISLNLQAGTENSTKEDFAFGLVHREILPEVTLRIGEWQPVSTGFDRPRVWDATAAWPIAWPTWPGITGILRTEVELDQYTFSVAGAVGLLLSDLWNWYDGTETNRSYAIGFGRGLQAVNIARNHGEDWRRG
ncbi:MAG UNVERIFIED_CONTAM: squalene/phytoene synthase family protein [Microcystis novacekii LVE1205-3]|jgi:farnesyl-diphosphate farnesyltransferase